MITASHNPKEDNGYKLYWENGAQLVSPYDQYIAASIDENRILWPEVETASLASASFLDNIMTACYFEDLKALRSPLIVSQKPSRKLIYTPMHGVGLKFAEKVFETFNFVPFIPTDSQKYPDADFPTVRFPNPEEKGAFVNILFSYYVCTYKVNRMKRFWSPKENPLRLFCRMIQMRIACQ